MVITFSKLSLGRMEGMMMEKEQIWLGTDGELDLHTGWVMGNSLDQIKQQVEGIRANFLVFLQTIDPNIKGIHTVYSQLDVRDDEKEMWLIKFSPKQEMGFTEEERI
jgi:hypothetical protein